MKKLLTLALAVSAVSVSFGKYLDEDHADLGAGWDGSNFDLHVHAEDLGLEFAPEDITLRVKEEALVSRPAGSQWDFLGIGAGQSLFVLPKTELPGVLYLGWGTEEIDPGTLDAYVETDARTGNTNSSIEWVTWNIRAVRGPGQVSVWDTDSFGAPMIWAATSNGLDATDKFIQVAGSHAHTNIGFTALGQYEIDLEVTGFVYGNLVQSGVSTYKFEAVPEPATLTALALSGLALLKRRKK